VGYFKKKVVYFLSLSSAEWLNVLSEVVEPNWTNFSLVTRAPRCEGLALKQKDKTTGLM
jgi:hypothetical protein